MIGQMDLIDTIQKQIQEKTFPHFSLLVGSVGSGRNTLIKEVIAKELKIPIYQVESGIDNIRKMIQDCYKIASPILYVIHDGDSLSTPAKNALLKITEESPNQAYIIMCLESLENTLETIRSRAVVYNIASYTTDEILTYFHGVYHDIEGYNDAEGEDIVKDLCETPGEVDALFNMGIVEFYDYVELAVDNITYVGWANALKSSGKIAMKKDDSGYDMKLFLKAFMSVCVNRMKAGEANAVTNARMVSITSKALQQLGIKGISKQMLFDDWIISLRKI